MIERRSPTIFFTVVVSLAQTACCHVEPGLHVTSSNDVRQESPVRPEYSIDAKPISVRQKSAPDPRIEILKGYEQQKLWQLLGP